MPKVHLWASGLAGTVPTHTITTYALYLLLVGVQWEVVTGPGPPRVEYRRYPLAIIALAAAGLVLLRLLWRPQRSLAWAGLRFLVLFGGLTVFSVGPPFLASATLLLIFLLLLRIVGRAPGNTSRAS